MEKPAAAAVILFDRIERSRAASIMMMMLRGLFDLKQGNSQVMQENIIMLRASIFISIVDLTYYVDDRKNFCLMFCICCQNQNMMLKNPSGRCDISAGAILNY